MFQTVCSLPRIRLPGALFKIQQYTLLHSFKTAVCLQYLAFGAEGVKQTAHTISHSKRTQWQSADILIPEAKYKLVEKNSKSLMNWFHR